MFSRSAARRTRECYNDVCFDEEICSLKFLSNEESRLVLYESKGSTACDKYKGTFCANRLDHLGQCE
jgi:hypothetical protein